MVEPHRTSSGLGTWLNHRNVCVFGTFDYFVAATLRFLRAGCIRWRPYRVECTGSLLTSEVKRRRARLVLGWGTAWEDLRVLSAFPSSRQKKPAKKNRRAPCSRVVYWHLKRSHFCLHPSLRLPWSLPDLPRYHAKPGHAESSRQADRRREK